MPSLDIKKLQRRHLRKMERLALYPPESQLALLESFRAKYLQLHDQHTESRPRDIISAYIRNVDEVMQWASINAEFERIIKFDQGRNRLNALKALYFRCKEDFQNINGNHPAPEYLLSGVAAIETIFTRLLQALDDTIHHEFHVMCQQRSHRSDSQTVSSEAAAVRALYVELCAYRSARHRMSLRTNESNKQAITRGMRHYVMFLGGSVAARQLVLPGGHAVLAPPPSLPPSYGDLGREAGIGDMPPAYQP